MRVLKLQQAMIVWRLQRFPDSTMVTSRVMVHFDDLLSVVNDAQLKSALNTYKEVIQLMKQASEQRKQKAGDKLTVWIRRN